MSLFVIFCFVPNPATEQKVKVRICRIEFPRCADIVSLSQSESHPSAPIDARSACAPSLARQESRRRAAQYKASFKAGCPP